VKGLVATLDCDQAVGVRTCDVLIVLFNGVQSLDVTGPMDVFTVADQLVARRSGGSPYRVRTASLGGQPVRAASGLTVVPDCDLRETTAPDLLLVPGGECAVAPEPGLVDWLREHGRSAARLVSVCTGTFPLAEAGLLTGRRVTTHWDYCARLARSYPSLTVERDPIFVRDGNVATSAGVTSGIDLALHLVEDDLGHQVALTVARYLVVFLRRPGNQAQFSIQLAGQLAQRDPLREVQRWILDHPDEDLSVPTLARRAHLSPRQFARAFADEVGMPPGRYVDQVRLEAARRRLEDTSDSIAHTARACGYRSAEVMRRAFLRSLAISPVEYRRRFRPAPRIGATEEPVAGPARIAHRRAS
jgi:transcriptional regulator GlxA family with amidase domain